jgi:beta-phosphoglucomutase-like phosphatase (HAD superfamily)
MHFTGGIFDVDGVLLDTPHAQAWREALSDLMAGPWHALAPSTSYQQGAFTDAVYQDYVAGKPRAAGAAAALGYFHVRDADGALARQLADVKQTLIERLAAAGDFRAYDDALCFLLQVKASGVRVCAASSSKNADNFLRAISAGAYCAREGLHYPFVRAQTTLLDLLDADVDGLDVPRGKPDPALFLAAARALVMAPEQCFVVEDAAVGIQAAKAGGMYGIGVARQHDEDLLRGAGADIVVARLDTIDVHTLVGDGFAGPAPSPDTAALNRRPERS